MIFGSTYWRISIALLESRMIPLGFLVGDFVSGYGLKRELFRVLEDAAGSFIAYSIEISSRALQPRENILEVEHRDLDESQHYQALHCNKQRLNARRQ